jgi:hypothetical protein
MKRFDEIGLPNKHVVRWCFIDRGNHWEIASDGVQRDPPPGIITAVGVMPLSRDVLSYARPVSRNNRDIFTST